MEFMNLGHRGAAAYAPENTMKSFSLALELGANGLETDVRETKDGVLVLFHDEDLHRYGSDEEIEKLEFQKLLQFDMGEGEKIVTLEEFLKKFGEADLFLDIEFKVRGIHKEVLEFVNQYVTFKKKITVTSFDFEVLRNMRELDKNINLAWLTHDLTDDFLGRLPEVDAKGINPKADSVTKEKIAKAKAHGYLVRAWGIEDELAMLRCLDCGVDGMTVNFPDKLCCELHKRR